MTLLIILIAVALLFDFLNGLHDAANSIATTVSTRVLSPKYAVAWAAFFNFIAFAVFGLHVATTVVTRIVSPSVISDQVIFGALMGGLVGAGICKTSFEAVVVKGLAKTFGAIVLSPATGFFLSLLLVLFVS
jgi:inorganic phosphate transporter, PiT family